MDLSSNSYVHLEMSSRLRDWRVCLLCLGAPPHSERWNPGRPCKFLPEVRYGADAVEPRPVKQRGRQTTLTETLGNSSHRGDAPTRLCLLRSEAETPDPAGIRHFDATTRVQGSNRVKQPGESFRTRTSGSPVWTRFELLRANLRCDGTLQARCFHGCCGAIVQRSGRSSHV